MLRLGIDLGTTFSLVAAVGDRGVPMLFPDLRDADAYRTPSAVHVGPDGCLVGKLLEDVLGDEPGLSHARFFKLAMGEARPVYRDDLGREWWPPALSALVLRKLLKDVEAAANTGVEATLITVPAGFDDAQRRATRDAARLAGLEQVKLIDEPVAAATYYGFDGRQKDRTLFVYDLGGGTFDATVLQGAEDGLYALATAGSNRLGGKWIDELIMRDVLDEFERQHGERPGSAAALQQVRRFAEDAKLRLSQPAQTRVARTLLVGAHTLEFVITRDHFERLLEQLVEETLVVCGQVLEKAGLDWGMVDEILLTGGSSLLPMIPARLAAVSGRPPEALVCRQPHQAVAFGAALLAEQLFAPAAVQRTLQQICAFDLGIRAIDPDTGQPAVRVLVGRNTPVPASARTTFYTTRDAQTRMIIEAVQVRGQGDQREEKSLGYFAFGPIEAPRRNYPVEIELGYDLDGLVVVRARDPETGRQLEQVMDGDGAAMPAELATQQDWVRSARIN